MNWIRTVSRRIWSGAMAMSILASATLLLLSAVPAGASHFRYGHLTWQPLGNNTARLTLVNAFRRTGYGGTAGDGFPAIGDIINENVGGTVLFFGDGTISGSGSALDYKVISIDPANDWLLAQALEPGSTTKTTIDHTYPGPLDSFGQPWIAEINSCCRTFTEINNPSGTYRVLTEVEFVTGGRSPVSGLPAIVNVTCNNAAASFVVPAVDPDPNTKLVYRLATSAEASGSGFNQPGPPFAPSALAIDANTGVVTWNTFGAACSSVYSCQVVIEDRDAVTTVKRGQVAVDFLLNLVFCDSTNHAPNFISPTPGCGSTILASAGIPMGFTVCAADPDGGVVSLNHAGLPSGASTLPVLPALGSPVCATFSWTPTAADSGDHVVTFTATDTCGAQSLCSFDISVSVAPPNHAPSCSTAVACEPVLWPPNHKFHAVSICGVTDPDSGDVVTITVTSITQDEPTNTRGDGNTCPDAQIVGGQASVRAERTGTPGIPGNGRVYTINFTADDGHGGQCSGSVHVCVPHDQSNPTCIDDGLAYNSLGPCRSGNVVTPEAVSLNVGSVSGGQAHISFALPTNTFVDVSVFDVTGRRVATLENGVVAQGTYDRTWNMDGVANGLYYVRLKAGGVTMSKSLLRIR